MECDYPPDNLKLQPRVKGCGAVNDELSEEREGARTARRHWGTAMGNG